MAADAVRAMSLLTVAALCLLLGFFLWRVNVALGNVFRHRETYAQNLRRAGREDEARRMEARTQAFARRVPLCGKILVAAGLALGLIGLLRLR